MRLAVLAGLLLATPAPAQEQDNDEIVVTGRGLGDDMLIATPRAAATSTIVIKRAGGTASGRMEDLLRDVPGLAQFRRSDSRSAHPTSQGVTMRGLGGNAASRMLVLIDEVPQADPFGGWVPFPAWMPERFGNVLVRLGGGSGFGGPGALAGTIEMISADPEALGRLRLGLDYGSRESVDARAFGGVRLGSGFATMAASYARGDGFVPVAAEDRGPIDRAAPYEQASLALRGVTAIGGTTELQASVSGFRDRRDRGVDFTAIKSDGADASVRIVGRGRWKWSALAYVQTRAFASAFASVNDARTSVTPTLDQYNVPSTGVGGRVEIQPPLGDDVTLRLGAEARRVSGKTQELFTYVAGLPTRRREAGGESLTFGGFANLRAEHGPLEIEAGARLDRWQIKGGHLVERPVAGGAALTDLAFADRSGWEGSAWLGGSLKLAEPVQLRGIGYRSWRLPTLNELYRPFRVGADATAANAALDPERLWGAEGGVDVDAGGGLSFHVTGYWNRLDGAIANVTLANGPGSFPGVGFVSAAGMYRRRQNLDAIRVRGVESHAQLRRGAFEVNLGWLHADARVRASGAAAGLDGLRPPQTARDSGTATLGWSRGDAAASLTARYIGTQFEDDQNSRRLRDALTVDALAAVPLGRGLIVRIRGENLFDARVEAGISGPGVIERASPRTVWFGIGYRLR